MGSKARRAKKANRDHRDRKDRKAKRAHKVLSDRKDLRVQPVVMVPPGKTVQQVETEIAEALVRQERLAHLARKDLKARPAKRVNEASKAALVQLVNRVRKASLDPPDR